MSAGALSRLAEEGSLQQEPGSGILGRVDGATVAVGNSDWIRRQDTLASPSHLGGSASDEGRFVGARLSSSHGASTSGRDSGSDRQSLAPGHSAVYVSIDGRPAGMLHVADTLRPHAWETVQALRRRGIRVGMLSGGEIHAACVARKHDIMHEHFGKPGSRICARSSSIFSLEQYVLCWAGNVRAVGLCILDASKCQLSHALRCNELSQHALPLLMQACQTAITIS